MDGSGSKSDEKWSQATITYIYMYTHIYKNIQKPSNTQSQLRIVESNDSIQLLWITSVEPTTLHLLNRFRDSIFPLEESSMEQLRGKELESMLVDSFDSPTARSHCHTLGTNCPRSYSLGIGRELSLAVARSDVPGWVIGRLPVFVPRKPRQVCHACPVRKLSHIEL